MNSPLRQTTTRYIQKFSLIAATALLLASCGTYSTSSVEPPTTTQQKFDRQQPRALKTPAQVTITENDILDHPYSTLGDIEVTVRKVTIFDADPNRQLVTQALQEKAAEMGADAVVLTRFGTVGIGLMSWGQMDGKGRAIVFK